MINPRLTSALVLLFVTITSLSMSSKGSFVDRQGESKTFELVDFQGDEQDVNFLEKTFKEHYHLLYVNHKTDPYMEGKGVAFFTTWAKKTKINERKILKVDNQPVASFICYIYQDNDLFKHINDGDGFIELFCAYPNKQGYGGIVMEYVLEYFEEHGCKTGWVPVNPDNVGAQTFYEKKGFKNTNHSGKDICWMIIDMKNRSQKKQ